MKNQLMWSLGVAGLLPFFAAAIAHPISAELIGINALLVFQSYSGVILAFLAGSLWGQSLSMEQGNAPWLLVFSNALALIAFSAHFLTTNYIAITLLLTGYVLVLLTEYYYRHWLVSSYLKMRGLLTVIVVLVHAFVLLSLL